MTLAAEERPPLAPPQPAPGGAPCRDGRRGTARRLAADAADVEAWLDGFMPYALAERRHRRRGGRRRQGRRSAAAEGLRLCRRREAQAGRSGDCTLFRPGSVSKLFTWTAVMQLVEQGKLDLDADVNKYLDFKIPTRDGKPITLRNIMTHTAGFEERSRT